MDGLRVVQDMAFKATWRRLVTDLMGVPQVKPAGILRGVAEVKLYILVGGNSNIFYFHPENLGKMNPF